MIDRSLVPASLEALGPATAAALLITAYLVLGEPVVGRVLHGRFESAERQFSDARRWLYRRLLLLEWGLAAVCVATIALAPGVDAGSAGIRLPQGSFAQGMSVGVVLMSVVLVVLTARAVAARPTLPPASEAVLAMLPRTPVERRLFAIVAVTAGICEELVFRGFLIAVLAALLPTAPVWMLAVLAAVVFGLAHLYQGAAGVITTLVMGLVLGGLYVVTGSLLAPVVLHACIDLRAISLGRLAPQRPHQLAGAIGDS